MQDNTIHIVADIDALSAAAAQRWAALSAHAIAASGQFHVALSGGSTPRYLFERLAGADYAARVDWRHTHVYFGDERYVPSDHADSNFRMAYEALLRHVPVPAQQIHRVQTELPSAAAAAAAYEAVLNSHLPRDAYGNAAFDLMLLGVGPDGHIASLFPGTDILQEDTRLVAASYVDKLAAWRISVTLPVINHARHIMMLAAGAGKTQILSYVLGASPGSEPLPVQMIEPTGGMEWYVDEAAAQGLATR